MEFIDTHCHLDDERYAGDLPEVLESALAKGVGTCVIPAASPATLPRAMEIAARYEGVYFACGLHPCEIEYGELDAQMDSVDSGSCHCELCLQSVAIHKLDSRAESSAKSSLDSNAESHSQNLAEILAHNHARLDQVLAHAAQEKCVAIGECGLDYYHFLDSIPKAAQKHAQKEIFITQIKHAIALDLPLIVHIREASHDAYEILARFPEARGILHCYNADEVLLKLQDRFCYGIGGVATFKNARHLLEVLPKIPLNRIVLETDAPYLTPHPFRGQRNSPEYIPLIADRVAEILGVGQDTLAQRSSANARKIFGI